MRIATIDGIVPDPADLTGVAPGTELVTCAWLPITRTQLAFYCAASGVTDPIHYDLTMAREHGFEDLVVNGSLRVGMFELLLRALWPSGVGIEQLRCRHRRGVLVGARVRTSVRLRSARRDAWELELTHEVDAGVTDTCLAALRIDPA